MWTKPAPLSRWSGPAIGKWASCPRLILPRCEEIAMAKKEMQTSERAVNIPIGKVTLHGDLSVPSKPLGLVLFAHGSGSSRRSPRNRFVAGVLQQAGIATLLFDLLTEAEERIDERTAELRFDIGLLASRLRAATDWVLVFDDLDPTGQVLPSELRLGY